MSDLSYARTVAHTKEQQWVTTAQTNQIVLTFWMVSGIGDLIRIHIGPSINDEVPNYNIQDVALWIAPNQPSIGNQGVGKILQGSGTASGSGGTEGTGGLPAGNEIIYRSSFSWAEGFLYVPMTEERTRANTGETTPYHSVGVVFPKAPVIDVSFAATIVWGEVASQ